MSKKDKTPKHAPEAPSLGAELAQANTAATPSTGEDKPKKERAPRIVRPRYQLTDESGGIIKFTHYALPTRRQASGKIEIDGVETEFTVTKSQSKDKTENRAYSYFKLPNGATGYVSQELVAGAKFTTKELPPAEPFGGKRGGQAQPQAEPAAA